MISTTRTKRTLIATAALVLCVLTAPHATIGFVALATARVVAEDRAKLAATIRDDKRVTLADSHSSGKEDEAYARRNIVDTAAGKKARRSHYGKAPGGEVDLDTRMLKGMIELAKSYTIEVTEIAGGSHKENSRHYAGLAFDVDKIDGKTVAKGHPQLDAFKKKCHELGANEVLGPGDKDHDHHVHAAWPRP